MSSGGILIRRFVYPVTVLGPGIRLGIWLQGCSIRCHGCMSPEMWDFDQKYLIKNHQIYERLLEFYNIGARAVVISGGEPFDQADEFLTLLSYIRNIGFDDILVYSGYNFHLILDNYQNHLEKIDILISGSFQYNLETNSRWYGSDNQTITVLKKNAEYDSESLDSISKNIEPSLQIELNEGEYFLIGILNRMDLKLFQKEFGELLYQKKI